MYDSILQKPAFTVTVGELIDVLVDKISKPQPLSVQPEQPQYLYSIQELAQFLHCSSVTAQKIKNSGRIRYRQIGRKVIFNFAEVLEDLSKAQKKKGVNHV